MKNELALDKSQFVLTSARDQKAIRFAHLRITVPLDVDMMGFGNTEDLSLQLIHLFGVAVEVSAKKILTKFQKLFSFGTENFRLVRPVVVGVCTHLHALSVVFKDQ